jgi:hypothetical protein
MSSISFVRPTSPASSTTSHSTTHTRRATFPLSNYDPDLAFQMNPLSFHPPRTPRPSIVSQPEMYNNDVSRYSEKSPYEQHEPSVKDDSGSDEGIKLTRVRQSEVWKDMIATSVGRDKALVSDPENGFTNYSTRSCRKSSSTRSNPIFCYIEHWRVICAAAFTLVPFELGRLHSCPD